MSASTELTDYYARRAAEYDRIYQKPERQTDLARLRTLLRELFAGRTVYEVACGTGYWTAVIAETASRIYATDFNEEVIAIGKSRAIPPGKVTWAQGDAFAPRKAPWPCDAGFAGFWWSHLRITEIAGFLDGFFERLEPGARFVVIDNAYVEGSSTPIARADEEGNTYQRRKLDDGSTHEVLKNFPGEADVRRWLEPRATNVTWERLPYFWMVSGDVR
jgi:SAM-dependent methyltransferase